MRMTTTEITLVCWRDIPAQVIVGKGRKAAKRILPERFEQAIDRAAMKVGASDTDAYLAEWRKIPLSPQEGDPSVIADREIARLDAEYDQDRIKALIANDGWA
jgi:hypothetical protein